MCEKREGVECVESLEELTQAALKSLNAEEAKARSILAHLEDYAPRDRPAIRSAYLRSLAQIARCKAVLREAL
jgi:hypothetical protein